MSGNGGLGGGVCCAAARVATASSARTHRTVDFMGGVYPAQLRPAAGGRRPKESMKYLAAIVLFVVEVAAQTPPRFEVASIKPSPRPPVGPIGVRIGPSQARFTFASLKNYI